MTAPPEDKVRSNLDWFGYGTPDSKFWFIEYEESMYDPQWYADCETLEEVLEHRAQYGEFIDFKTAWEDLCDRPLTAFTNWSYTWNYEAAFRLGAAGHSTITNQQTHNYAYRDARLGRCDSDSFTAEASPLPKSDCFGTGPYGHIWPSPDAYLTDVRERRLAQLDEYLCGNDTVEWIVVSGQENLMMELFRECFVLSEIDSLQHDQDRYPYEWYEMQVTDDQCVNVVHAPYFGQAQTTYQNAATAGYNFVHRN